MLDLKLITLPGFLPGTEASRDQLSALHFSRPRATRMSSSSIQRQPSAHGHSVKQGASADSTAPPDRTAHTTKFTPHSIRFFIFRVDPIVSSEHLLSTPDGLRLLSAAVSCSAFHTLSAHLAHPPTH